MSGLQRYDHARMVEHATQQANLVTHLQGLQQDDAVQDYDGRTEVGEYLIAEGLGPSAGHALRAVGDRAVPAAATA